MAKIGLEEFRYSILSGEDNTGSPIYSGALQPAHAISCSVSISNNSVQLYGDNRVIESDTSFQSGTVSIGIDKEDKETMSNLLGHTLTDGELIRNANDISPYVGLGRIITEMINGVMSYTVEFLHKCKFGEPSQENATKGESVEFSTYTLEGTISTLSNGVWSKCKSFTTQASAVEYLEGLMAAPTP